MTSTLRPHRISLVLASIVLAAGLGGSVGAQEQPPPEEVPSGIPVPEDSELGVVHSWALAPAGAGGGSNTSDRAFLSDYDLTNDSTAVSTLHMTGLSDRNYATAQLIHYRSLVDGENQDVVSWL